jgi:hypothetical protein
VRVPDDIPESSSSDPVKPYEVGEVDSIMADCLRATGRTADVTTTWSERAGMWFVETDLDGRADDALSVGMHTDTFLVSRSGRTGEFWGTGGALPYEQLRDVLLATLSGRKLKGNLSVFWRFRAGR